VCEEDTADTEAAPPSTGDSPALIVSATDDAEAPDRGPDDSDDGGDEAGES
jgi:hypothetical protein